MEIVSLNYDRFLIIHVQINHGIFRTDQLLIVASCDDLGIPHYICFSNRPLYQ
jgi:hypothetical protein